MTELINGFAQSHIGRTAFDHLDGPTTPAHWDEQYIEPLAMLTAGWPQGPGTQMSGIQQLDVRFDHPDQSYFHHHHNSSPNIGYPISDIGTPSSNGNQEAIESYPAVNDNLYPHRYSLQSPHSSISGLSPNPVGALGSPSLPSNDGRPPLHQRNSAPEPYAIAQVNKNSKHSKAHSDEDDDEYEPHQQQQTTTTTGGRGRKRQRIPHTAVERRYRENLNAHLEKLRQTVPSLAARKGPGGGSCSKVDGGEGVRPSKCEILHGAIEYIGTQDKLMSSKDRRIAELAQENAILKANFEQMQNWIRANSH